MEAQDCQPENCVERTTNVLQDEEEMDEEDYDWYSIIPPTTAIEDFYATIDVTQQTLQCLRNPRINPRIVYTMLDALISKAYSLCQSDEQFALIRACEVEFTQLARFAQGNQN